MTTTHDDLAFLGATELGALAARGEVGAVEVLDAYLARLDAFDAALRSHASVDREGARRAALAAERELRAHGPRGPLHGVPISHKDNLWTAGWRTRVHSRTSFDQVPAEDATAVARLRAAGTVFLGKTNTTEFACGDQHVHGDTPNPWGADLHAGPRAPGRPAPSRRRSPAPPPAAIPVGRSARRPRSAASSASSPRTGASAGTGWCRSRGRWTTWARWRARRRRGRHAAGHGGCRPARPDDRPAGGARGLARPERAARGRAGRRAGRLLRRRPRARRRRRRARGADAARGVRRPARTHRPALGGRPRGGREPADDVGGLRAPRRARSARGRAYGPKARARIASGAFHAAADVAHALQLRALWAREVAAAFAEVDALVTPTLPFTAVGRDAWIAGPPTPVGPRAPSA